jgi:tRNA G18 (ribose-2'-O)-methylase SpoU
MKQKITTIPNLLDSAPLHQVAALNKNEHLESWTYNVIDEFKHLTVAQIKHKLAETAFPYAVLCENVIGDFNLGTIIRNANAFNAREIYYIGNKKFDRRGMCGVHNYSDVKWLSTIDELLALKDKYVFVGVDNISGAIPVSSHSWEKNTLLIFGEEGVGLTPTIQKLCDKIVYIEQFGSVRSLNVGTASGIIMHQAVSSYKTSAE